MPGTAIASSVELDPGRTLEIPLRFQLSQGEYEFLAGYGGGYFGAPVLASNRFGFDVDGAGKAHLVKGSTISTVVRPAHHYAPVCGRVILGDGTPAARSRVFLWPYPIPKEKANAANFALADSGGWFRMESALKGPTR